MRPLFQLLLRPKQHPNQTWKLGCVVLCLAHEDRRVEFRGDSLSLGLVKEVGDGRRWDDARREGKKGHGSFQFGQKVGLKGKKGKKKETGIEIVQRDNSRSPRLEARVLPAQSPEPLPHLQFE